MKFKVGDRVQIKSLDWYYDNRDRIDEVACGNTNFIPDMVKYCEGIVTISSVLPTLKVYHIKEDSGMFNWTDEMIEGLVEEEKPLCEGCCSLELKYNKLTIADNICTDKVEIILQDYELKREGDKWFAVKKKKEYPKTYEECAGRIMRVELWNTLWGEDATEYEEQTEDLIDAFIRLKICRDAYWKIAGEEMGLGKPWKPDWDNLSTNHEFIKINKGCFTYSSRVLVFPTEEMRDAFYESFKSEIKVCKELL